MKKRLSVILLILFTVFLVIYISTHLQDFKSLTLVNPIYLLIIALGHIFGIYLNGLFLKYILEPFDKIISNLESFEVSLISTVSNYFFPVGTGAGIKAVYLKKKFKVSYTDFISTLSGNYILVFLISSFVGLFSLYFLREHSSSRQYTVLVFIFGTVFTVMLYMATLGFPEKLLEMLESTKKLQKPLLIISNILKGWNTIKNNRKLLIRLILITILNLVVNAGISYVAIIALNLDITLPALLLYTALGALSFLLNITPGSIGIREAILIFSSTVIGFSIPQVLSVSVIEKGILFIVLFITWILIHFGIIKTKTLKQ